MLGFIFKMEHDPNELLFVAKKIVSSGSEMIDKSVEKRVQDLSEQVEGIKKDLMDFTDQKLDRMAEAILSVIRDDEKNDINFEIDSLSKPSFIKRRSSVSPAETFYKSKDLKSGRKSEKMSKA